MKKLISLLLVLAMIVSFGSIATFANEAEVNHVIDVSGREVDVPANAQHVVLLPGPAYEKAMLLGVTDRVGGILKSCKTA